MEGKIILAVKFMVVWIYSFALSPFAQALIEINDKKTPPDSVFWVFVGMIFLPEILLVFSNPFRSWIRKGIENSEDMTKKYIQDLIIHYASLSSLRLFVLESLLMMFYEVHIPFQYYIVPFFGSIGLSGFSLLKNIYKKSTPDE